MAPYYPDVAPAFTALLEALGSRPVAVVGHARPDGDCIGSQIAVARMLRQRGLEVTCVNPDTVPRRLRFITRDEVFMTPADLPAGEYDAIYVDCADHARAGKAARERFPQPVGNIDHHLSNVGYAAHNCVAVQSAATCEILAGLFLDHDIVIDENMAQGLYAGIITDTGQFRFASTTHQVFMLAAELVGRGANPVTAGYELYEREPAGKLQLLQRYLASFTMHGEGRICVGVLEDGVFEDTGTNQEDTEGLVDYSRSIDGVDIGALIEERSDGIKGSLRAQDPKYRVDQVASLFNGGGHACAAGLNVKGVTAKEFRPKLVEALMRQLAVVDGATESV